MAGAGLYLAYEIAGTLLLIFAGVLVAAILDAATLGLGRILPIGRLRRLAIASILIFALTAGAAIWGGVSLIAQAQNLLEIAIAQAEIIGERVQALGVSFLPEISNDDEGGLWGHMLAPETLFGHAQTAFGMTTGLLSGIVIVLFLGLFFAADPAAYRDGFLKLVPVRRRERVGQVLEEAGRSLRWWLVGQLATMAIVAVSIATMLLLVGIPNAILLGTIAGILNFIPFVGPILAGVPVFLAVMPEGLATLTLVMVLFIAIESIEGYLINPMVQERAVHLPPAWSLAALVVFGALFGGIGIALATPVFAVARIIVLRLYVEDGLESGARAPEET